MALGQHSHVLLTMIVISDIGILVIGEDITGLKPCGSL